LVLTKTFPAQPSGSFVALDLTDDWGEPLANGLYYIVLTIGRDRATAKLVLAP